MPNKRTRVLNAVDRFRELDAKKKNWSPLGLFLSLAVTGGIIAYTAIVCIKYVEDPTVSSYSEPIEGERFPMTITCQSPICNLKSAYGPQSTCQDVAFGPSVLTYNESITVDICYSIDPIDGIIATYSNSSLDGTPVIFGLTISGKRLILDDTSSDFLTVVDQIAYVKEGTTYLQIIHYWNLINGDKGNAYYPVTIIEDSSVYDEQYGANLLPANQTLAHIAPWLVYTSIKVSRSSVLSLVGTIGGFLDLLVKGAVIILIIVKCVVPKGDDEKQVHKEEMTDYYT